MVKDKLTQVRLKESLEYNPDLGLFKWKKPYRKIDKDWFGAIREDKNVYKYISFDNKTYLAHRIAFLYMEGYLPLETVDHINGIKSDNRWSNLRECSYQENNLNVPKTISNKSGCKGVDFRKSRGVWRVRCSIKGKSKNFGHYKDYELACLVSEEVRDKYHGEFANHGWNSKEG